VAVATFSARLRAEQTEEEQLRAAASALYYMPFMTPRGLIGAYARYNPIIREVAQATGALLIEGEFDIPGDALHFADSVHFTDAGSRAMATRVSGALARRADALAGP
jgi:lysophospholipase L1-like esterase